ncbi:MAG: exonuclease domain-containing protein [Xanthomonadaceae bacterium]|jgi:inhibitor of KinA sporulation pathway (predicted exonuclease)|nr:exonuclease domain-containing protein [Xanthomonadaceae bacterium]
MENKSSNGIENLWPFYLVVDLEATCCNDGSIPQQQMEIIEIGAVMVDADSFAVIGEFQSFVRPVRHPRLTSFCTQLTSIRQEDVDTAPDFSEAASAFKRWLRDYPGFVFCSWGDYDFRQLHQDCDFHRLANPISAMHLNVRRLLTERQRLIQKPGLKAAVRMAGLAFAGIPHRGIDDARNIARLLPYVFGNRILSASSP